MHRKRARGPARAGGPTARVHIAKFKKKLKGKNLKFPNKKRVKLRKIPIKKGVKRGKKGVKKH